MRSHKIISYDLADSFDRGAKGHEVRRVISTSGDEVLIEEIWSAGLRSYDTLREFIATTNELGAPVTGEEVAAAFESMAEEIDSFLSQGFLPAFVAAVDSGRVKIEPTALGKSELLERWRAFDVVERLDIFFRWLKPLSVELEPNPSLLRAMAAFAVLARIDDVHMASALDDINEALRCGAEIERFQAKLDAPDGAQQVIESAVAAAFSRRARASVQKRFGPLNLARHYVSNEWDLHRVAYGGNKSEFARHYVRLVLSKFGVSIKEKTIREVWLSGTPPAS